MTHTGEKLFYHSGTTVDLEKQLTLALMKMADRIAAESNGTYYPVAFRNDVETLGGLAVSRTLINQPISEGFMRLVQMKRPDLSLEALIYAEPKYHPLFTEEELAICKRRAEMT